MKHFLESSVIISSFSSSLLLFLDSKLCLKVLFEKNNLFDAPLFKGAFDTILW